MLGQLGGAPSCPCCDQKVYFSNEKSFAGKKWHKTCFLCAGCRKVLENSTAHLLENDVLNCKTCHQKNNGLVAAKPINSAAAARSTNADSDNLECCPRCARRVYFAEQILSLGRKWHRPCFSCFECKKTIEVSAARDHEQELYCKTCYGRLFGPKGYGFAGGAGTMLSMDTGKDGDVATSNIPAVAQAYVAPAMSRSGVMTNEVTVGNIDTCVRCKAQVFIAEKKHAAGNVYHSLCFTCMLCTKKLDSTTLTEKDGEVYCKSCYGKNFAPKGYGYGSGAGTLQMS